MAALDLITLADLKAYKPVVGTAADTRYSRLVTDASRILEAALGRRIVYRAPPEVATYDNILSTAFANGTPAGSAPNAAGRTLIVLFPPGATAGTVAVTGTVAGVAGTTETFDVVDGLLQHGLKFFTAISGITIANAAGAGTLKIGTSIGYVDYHTPRRAELISYEWPRQQTLEINEDASRAYGSLTKLTLAADFLVTRGSAGDTILRLNSNLPISWIVGWRSIKDVNSSGYRVADVPEELKDTCRRLVVLLFQEVDKGQIEVASGSNALGNWSRMGPAMLTKSMRQQISHLRRYRFGADTAERDWDLEAA
jgi:hypothetical protein